jgi:hypothetical protein
MTLKNLFSEWIWLSRNADGHCPDYIGGCNGKGYKMGGMKIV